MFLRDKSCFQSSLLWAVGGSVVGQLLVTYFRPLQEVFQTEALSVNDLFYIILLSSTVLWLDTLRKKIFPHWFNDGFHASPMSKKEDPVIPYRSRWLSTSGGNDKAASSWLSF